MNGKILSLITLSFAVSSMAHALPGTSGIVCHSLKGAKTAIRISANAADIEGIDSGFPSEAEVVYGTKSYKDSADDGTLPGIKFLKHPMDGVIDVQYTADKLSFEVWALPGTFTLQKGSDELNGKASFKAHATSYAGDEGYLESTLQCVFTYSGGSAG
ncbi:MAG: hypothetical protein ACXVA9_07130 [Bdellovibrionales bacterium]